MKNEPLSTLLSIPQRDEACVLYQSGLTSSQVADRFGVSFAGICDLLKHRQIPSRAASLPMHSEAEHAEICKLYLGGKPAQHIAKDLNVDIGTIINVLRRSGVKQRSYSERNRKRHCDHTFFDNVDNEAKAYWLGFIAADGYVGRPQRGTAAPELTIGLQGRDREHLALFNEVIQSDYPIRERRYSSGRLPKDRSKTFVVLSVRSRPMADALARYGVVPAKCHTFEWPDLPSTLSPHFLRGYFDGDGGWKIIRSLKSAPQVGFEITSDRRFLDGCQAYLMQACNLRRTKLTHRIHKGKYTASKIQYGGNRQARRIFHLMYDNATIYLRRKYEIPASYLL